MSVGPSLRVEEALNAGYESEGIREAEMVTACARENGLDGYTHLFDPPPLNPILLDGEETMSALAYVETYGTGTIAKTRLRVERMGPGAFDESPFLPETPEVEDQILYFGPVVTPDGEEFEGGCAEWARENVVVSGLTAQREELVVFYSEAISDNYYESVDYLALEDEFAVCMAGEGFPGLSGIGDAGDLASEMQDTYLADLSTYDEAFQADRVLGLAWYECSSPLGERREALGDKADAAFYEAHKSEVEALRGND